jgi:hypothetical protein
MKLPKSSIRCRTSPGRVNRVGGKGRGGHPDEVHSEVLGTRDIALPQGEKELSDQNLMDDAIGRMAFVGVSPSR